MIGQIVSHYRVLERLCGGRRDIDHHRLLDKLYAMGAALCRPSTANTGRGSGAWEKQILPSRPGYR